MNKVQTKFLKGFAVASFFIVFLSACGGSEGETNDAAALVNVPDAGNTNVTNPVDGTDSSTELSSGPSHLITGEISLLSDDIPVGEILVQVRDTDIRALRQVDGKFYIAVPDSEIDSDVVLDFTGESIVEKNMSLTIPADSPRSSINTTLAARTPAIPFNLDVGGDLQNEGSPTRVTVSVPANAFQFTDGTPATGMAQVNITELDILDLEADFSWAPNLIGIPEGGSERSSIRTFGMSEFHFSQNGRTLDLRPGVNATLSMDLAAPYVVTEETGPLVSPFVDAYDGAVLPLWYYDTADLVWREEGEAVVSADNESDSGFKATGEVSHFTYWNIDYITPFVNADIHINVVDQDGNPRNDVEVMTYHTAVYVPPEAGESAHPGEGFWSNSDVLTPTNNIIQVLGNFAERRGNYLSMNIEVKDVTTKDHGVISNGVLLQQKVFDTAIGDYSVYFEVVVEDPEPEPKYLVADVVVQLVDLDGNPRIDLTASSYTVVVSTESDNGFIDLYYGINLTPTQRAVVVAGNSEEYLASGAEPATTRITLDQLFVDGNREISLLAPISVVETFSTDGETPIVVLTVPVVDL